MRGANVMVRLNWGEHVGSPLLVRGVRVGYISGMRICVVILVVVLGLPGCADDPVADVPGTPRIVALTAIAGVDSVVTLEYLLPTRDGASEPMVLDIDWGDGLGLERRDTESGFRFSATHSYFDAGVYEVRIRATGGNGRISAWSEAAVVRIEGASRASRGDWWMFMRDARHSGASSLAGPERPQLLFSLLLPSPVFSTPVFNLDGTAHFGCDDHALRALYPDGRVKWRYVPGTGRLRGAPALDEQGTMYFGSTSANVYAVDRSGRRLWNYSTSAPITHSSPVITPTGLIVIGSDDGMVYALDAEGRPRWSVNTSFPILGSPACGNDGTVYVVDAQGILTAIAESGTVLWTFATGFASACSPSVRTDGSIVLGNDAGRLHCLESNGRLHWRREFEQPIRDGIAVLPDGRMIFLGHGGRLYCAASDGREQWHVDIANSAEGLLPAVDVYGNVYVGTPEGAVLAFDDDGREKWRFQSNERGAIRISIGQNGALYCVSASGAVFVLGER